MGLGVSSYAYIWRAPELSPQQMLEDAAALGCSVFQACDLPWLERPPFEDLVRLRTGATRLGLTLETGTKGVRPAHLLRHLETASSLGARLVRSMLSSPTDHPTLPEAITHLRAVMPAYERAGVTLGLETYEQFSSSDLVRVVESVGSDHLGIILDPGNSVARLEHPMDVTTRVAPYVVGLHVKDFAFTRAEGSLGFTLAGVPLGRGLLDYEAICDVLDEHTGTVNHVIEHWLPRQADDHRTRELESQWVADSVAYLRTRARSPRTNPATSTALTTAAPPRRHDTEEDT